jgi:hypothetical protein
MEFQVRTTAKYRSICTECKQRITPGEVIVQVEGNNRWAHAVCKRNVRVGDADACKRESITTFGGEQ